MLGGVCASGSYALESSWAISPSLRSLMRKNLVLLRCSRYIELAFFCCLQFVPQICLPVFLREIPNYHNIHEFPMAIAGPSLSLTGKGKAHEEYSFRTAYMFEEKLIRIIQIHWITFPCDPSDKIRQYLMERFCSLIGIYIVTFTGESPGFIGSRTFNQT
jgi:hypothetical protein